MSATSEAQKSVQAAAAFHTWHSSRTWNAGHPDIDPWMREVLVNLQSTLNTMAQTQVAIAEHVDRNTGAIQQIANHLSDAVGRS